MKNNWIKYRVTEQNEDRLVIKLDPNFNDVMEDGFDDS